MTRLKSVSMACLATCLLASVAIVGCGDDDPTTQCETIKSELVQSKKDCMGAAPMSECVSCYEECDTACATVDDTCPVRFICPK